MVTADGGSGAGRRRRRAADSGLERGPRARVDGSARGAHLDRLGELNRRNAVVFIHPAQLPGPLVPGVPAFAVDFLLDTTRAAVRLMTSGTMARCPNIKVILSHAGGFVPFALHRIAITTSTANVADGLAQLRRFYYDAALSGTPAALPSLLAAAAPHQILFGTDFPHAPLWVGETVTTMYEAYSMSDAQRASIDRGAAEKLFPRLKR